MIRFVLLVLLPLLVLVLPGAAARAEPPPARLGFAIYSTGLNVMVIDSQADIGPDSYRIDLAYRSTGLFGTLFPSTIDSMVQGTWSGVEPRPQRFASWGTFRSAPRRVMIEYVAGQPALRELEPASEEDRDPVPPEMQRNTIDTLSAMAFLVRQVAKTGGCDGQVRSFDGRRVIEITARTAGRETLRSDYRSSFAGVALRCDFAGRQLAGFKQDVSESERKRVNESSAWLAPILPDQPALPVRIVFETRFFGNATAFLTAAVPGARR